MDGAVTKEGNFAHNNTQPPKEPKILPRFSLKGKTAIVSGAGAGIGLQVARGMAEAGANTAILFNSNKKAHDRASEIEKEFGIKCRSQAFLACDTSFRLCRLQRSLMSSQGIPNQCYRRRQRQVCHNRHRQGLQRTPRYLYCKFRCSMARRSGNRGFTRSLS